MRKGQAGLKERPFTDRADEAEGEGREKKEGNRLNLIVIEPEEKSAVFDRLRKVLEVSLEPARKRNVNISYIDTVSQLQKASEEGTLQNTRILFAVCLNEAGINLQLYQMIGFFQLYPSMLEGSVGSVIMDGADDLFTTDTARKLVFAANMAGCTFPGKPLVEGTGSLKNFDVIAKNLRLGHLAAYKESGRILVEKLLSFQIEKMDFPSILAVHASSRKTSNSLMLWSEVARNIGGQGEIEEVSIRNGQVWDCRGCKYEACLHFGENSSCFYGGLMVEKVYPSILRSNVLVLICPNYNDAVSANIMAFINRLTALFRTNDFSKKRIYAIVVSGYSGGDIVAQQILGAINMNKNFILPAKFAMIETANNPGDIKKIDRIEEKAAAMADHILLRERNGIGK